MHPNEITGKRIGIFLSIFLVFALVLNFALLKHDILFSPAENSVYSLLSDVKSNPTNYQIVVGNSISSQEEGIINNFSSKLNVDKIKLSETVSSENKIFIGLASSFSNLPYQNKLVLQQAIVVFNLTTNTLYIYASDLDSLNAITQILADFNSYPNSLNNFAIEFTGGYLEELFLEPVIISRRTIAPAFLNQETKVTLDVEVFRPIDSLLIAELLTSGFNIQDNPGIINSTNLVVWYSDNLNIGNYSFNYTLLPTVNSGQIFGKSGVKIGDSEEDYQILGQSSITINNDLDTPIIPGGSGGSGGGGSGSGGGFTPVTNLDFINFQDLTLGKSLSKGKSESIILEINPRESYTLVIGDIQKNYVSLILQPEIKINLILGQSTKISLTNSKLYELYFILDKIESGKAYFSVKRINEVIKKEDFNFEMPASVNSSILTIDKSMLIKTLIFSAVILIIIIVSLVLFNKKSSNKFAKKEEIPNLHLERAKAIVLEYKKRGYSNESIKQIFRVRGWNERDIDRIF